MTKKEAVYALLAVFGLVLPWYFNLTFLAESGGGVLDFDWMGFLNGSMANPAASSILMDLTVGCLASVVFMVVEARRLGISHGWIFVVLTFSVAFAFALPLFLWVRERKLRTLGLPGNDRPRSH